MKRSITFIFFIVILFTSCAKEEVINISERDEPALKANSALADLMQRTSLRDGSNDNIIDNANCLSIKLPVTVIANGQEIVVNTEEDYDLIENVFDKFNDDEDEIQIIFPITIILSDYTQIMINNENEFDNFSGDCNGENETDDDIECLDFQYPVNVSIFNIITELIVDITLNNDEEMHDFIEGLDENDSANIDFPITIFLFDDTEVRIDSLDELENVIESAKDDCDEDDDLDFNDDDCINCTQEQLLNILTSCSNWIVDELKINGNDIKDDYMGYTFNFSSDGTLMVQENSNNFSGTWSSSGSGENIIVVINIPDLPVFIADWKLDEIIIEQVSGESKVDLRLGENHLKFESDCN